MQSAVPSPTSATMNEQNSLLQDKCLTEVKLVLLNYGSYLLMTVFRLLVRSALCGLLSLQSECRNYGHFRRVVNFSVPSVWLPAVCNHFQIKRKARCNPETFWDLQRLITMVFTWQSQRVIRAALHCPLLPKEKAALALQENKVY